ncbi:hypothetical protein [Jannaschia formosa]|uniref:hypothetical protein n=1 Tax=Jannaschia formosa TaxID=2259592 RepID=UPI000E1BE349|nr:hypothetical protein [Jannaschia formosa]TFL20207.1 hypothetical protein DR046_02360 [Jannaschia formosa]
MSADALKVLTESHAACRAALFADLATSMVLLVESRATMHREAQQELALRGGELLSVMDRSAPDTDLAVSVTVDEVAVFLRVPDAPTDVLCCLCAPEVDLGAFAADARACLNALAGAAG